MLRAAAIPRLCPFKMTSHPYIRRASSIYAIEASPDPLSTITWLETRRRNAAIFSRSMLVGLYVSMIAQTDCAFILPAPRWRLADCIYLRTLHLQINQLHQNKPWALISAP